MINEFVHTIGLFLMINGMEGDSKNERKIVVCYIRVIAEPLFSCMRRAGSATFIH